MHGLKVVPFAFSSFQRCFRFFLSFYTYFFTPVHFGYFMQTRSMNGQRGLKQQKSLFAYLFIKTMKIDGS